MVVAFVVAVARNGVIGRDGDLPWHMPSDLKLFRRLTMGKPIVMGRRTWSTLQRKPLDGRDNIVVTRDIAFRADGAIVVHTPAAALAEARRSAIMRGTNEVIVIGGAEIYRSLLPDARRIYLTEIAAEPEGDAFFAPLDTNEWHEISRETLQRGPRDEHDAVLRILERR
ncbi:MAG: dihydrofolate reductase [Hyphomicrobiaceae bacterium]|nr:dihydrofolate reductase [Hyphomicrobiaceae bacterium]